MTTTSGQGRIAAAGPAAAPFALPYHDDLDSYPAGKQARYLADEEGAFETVACGGGRAGGCLRQMAPIAPIYWHAHDGNPYTLVGDGAWSNYTISADVLLEEAGSVALVGRFSARDYWQIGHIGAYYFKVGDDGSWSIDRGDTSGGFVALTSGKVGALGTNQWHTLALTMSGPSLSATLDGTKLGSASDVAYGSGLGGLAVGAGDAAFANAQFDNLQVTAAAAATTTYTIANVNSGKLLTIAGTTDGVAIVQSTAIAGSATQQWQLTPLPGGAYVVVNVGSKKALEVPNFSQTAGQALDLWTVNQGTNQQWRLVVGAGGVVALTNVSSGLVADVPGGSLDDGVGVNQWTANSGTNQQWRFQATP